VIISSFAGENIDSVTWQPLKRFNINGNHKPSG